ncbi:hypothetical protein FD754_015722 [Muntiacus muntjak]|uniref:Alkaline ceramidase n=1 Tax=Muntiacus muntjak TaxID=9888 RepID=A0A5N3VR33_MUNMU|nr:hypothetical protein FD754_015722 [Muntiacus muntjak]
MAPAGDREGYWGPTTSTLDWCEENYAVTWYIAEFFLRAQYLILLVPAFGKVQRIFFGSLLGIRECRKRIE